MDPSQDNPLLMEEIPHTLEQLLERIGKLFHCMTGPPTAYFDIPLADRAVDHDLPIEPSFERMVYVTLGWSTPRERTAPGVESGLVGAMLEPFIDARRQIDERCGTALLFWRRPLLLEGLDETNHEGVPTGGRMTRLTCRVVIPGANLGQYAHIEGDYLRRL